MERESAEIIAKIHKTIEEQKSEISAIYPGSDIGNQSQNNYLLPENIEYILPASESHSSSSKP